MNKKIGIILTGTIGNLRGIDLARELRREGHSVHFIVSRGAKKLLTRTMLEWASGNRVSHRVDGFTDYLKLGQEMNCFFVFASADFIAKLAHGINDEIALLTLSVAMGSGKPILLMPLMHKSLLTGITRENLEKLRKNGITLVPAMDDGERLKVPGLEELVVEIERAITPQDLKGKQMVVSLGKTIEKIDSFRIITNLASGKLGAEIAKELYRRGAGVTAICGNNGIELPRGIVRIDGQEYREISRAIIEQTKKAEWYFSTIAVGDFGVSEARDPDGKKIADKKISSKKGITLELEPREKILDSVGCKTVVFSFGFEQKKIKCELMVFMDADRNSFGSDSAELKLIKEEAVAREIKGTKKELAREIVGEVVKLIG